MKEPKKRKAGAPIGNRNARLGEEARSVRVVLLMPEAQAAALSAEAKAGGISRNELVLRKLAGESCG